MKWVILKKHFSESFDTPDTSSQSTVVWKKNFETHPSTHLWLLSLQIRSFLRTLLAYFFPLSPAKFFSLGLPSIVYEGCRIQKRCLVVRMKEASKSSLPARLSQAKQGGRNRRRKNFLTEVCAFSPHPPATLQPLMLCRHTVGFSLNFEVHKYTTIR